MSSRTTNFLDSLSIEELAFFYKYKFPTYSKATKDFILKYFEKEKIDINTLQVLASGENISKKIIQKENPEIAKRMCSRCGSTKREYDGIYVPEKTITQSREGNNFFYSSVDNSTLLYELNKNKEEFGQVRCLVCGLPVHNNEVIYLKNDTFWTKAKKIFNWIFPKETDGID